MRISFPRRFGRGTKSKLNRPHVKDEARIFMRLAHLTWTSVLTALLIGGCASRGNIEVLESALRQREDQLSDLTQQLKQTAQERDIALNEANQLRQQLAQRGEQAPSPEHLANEFKAVGVRFNTYLTSGIDRDDQPGDEQLSILLYPHDEDGGLVKLNGSLELRAVDLTAPKDQQEVGVWRYSLEETKEAWHSGFLAAGFLLEEEWQKPIQGSEITLHARFKTADGRQFDAVQPLHINPPGDLPLADNVGPIRVKAGKPPIMHSGHRQLERPNPVDPQPSEDGFDELENVAAPIPTSDRFREWDTPQYR